MIKANNLVKDKKSNDIRFSSFETIKPNIMKDK